MGVGSVILVGAGPGSPDLITLRGLRALRRADLLICDALLPPTFLEELGLPATGKTIEQLQSGEQHSPQSAINDRMLEAARAGKTVVRLKCGDPFVFGRGSEELDFLRTHGVPVEVVPGLSSCIAAPAAAGMSLTDRRHGRSFAAVTARRTGGSLNSRYPRADSLVIFMGVERPRDVAAGLLRDGWPADTPAAAIERATLPWERRVRGALAGLPALAERAGIASPAVILVGAVAGRCILYTGLAPANFRVLGDVIHWPAFQVVPDEAGRRAAPDALKRLATGEFDRVIFTSPAGVRSFFALLDERGLDARALAGTQLVTAGPGTALLLREHGLRADVIPAEPGSAGMLNATHAGEPARGELVEPARVLLVQGTHAPASLLSELRRRGCAVTRLALHRVAPNPELGRPLPHHDVIYFTSPSGVRAYWDAYREKAFAREVWCIGEVTLDRVLELGFDGKVVSPHVLEDQTAAAPAL